MLDGGTFGDLEADQAAEVWADRDKTDLSWSALDWTSFGYDVMVT